MRIPKRVSDILKQKQDYIDLHRGKMEDAVLRMQSKLLDNIIAEIIPQLKVKDKTIQDNVSNYRLLGNLDNVYNDFLQTSGNVMTFQIYNVTNGLNEFGIRYYKSLLTDNIPARFDKIIEQTAKKMNLRIGLKEGELIDGGFLKSFLTDKTLGTQIKQFISDSVTGQADMKDFIKGLSEIVNGKEGPGSLEKQYQRFAYDLYQQYDAAYSSSLGEEFGMKYFIYSGGLIEDSRDFCAAHNGKVWSIEESQTWPDWVPADGEYPAGYQIKSKSPYEIPSYLSIPGYQPLISRGGPRCRHSIGYIPDDMAFDLRPELKGTQ